jgi:uncharacterized membrane protein
MIFEKSIVIDRPIEQVFELATCLRRCVVWRNALLSSTQVSEGPVGVGTTFEQEVRGFGGTFRNSAVVTEYEPPRLFAYEKVEGPDDFKARFSFEAEGDSTRFDVWLDGDSSSGWVRLIPAPLIRKVILGEISQEMETLKAMMENDVDMDALLASET